MRAKQWRPSGDSAIPRLTISWAGIRVMFSSANTTFPDLGGVSPEIERNVVDFPAPLDPIIVTISPSSTVSETPWRASIVP